MDWRRLLRPQIAVPTGTVALGAGTWALWQWIGAIALFVLFVVLVVAIMIVILMIYLRLRAVRGEAAISKTIMAQADKEIVASAPESARQITNAKARLLAAFASHSRRRGPGGMARLPLYLVLGPQGSGKSTLVLNSDLNFLDEHGQEGKPVPGIGGTRGFDWWLSNDAIVLDLAQRSLQVDADEEPNPDWAAVLQVLKRQRPLRPVNGVLLVLPVDRVAGPAAVDLGVAAARIRAHLHGMAHHLGVRFPVYVVFSGIDRLAGFREFFADLDEDERGKVWGATLEFRRRSVEETQQAIDGEVQLLVRQLAERRLGRVGALPEGLLRERAFAFPLQVEKLREPIRRMLGEAFRPDLGGDSPFLRGFYFTSVVPIETPTERPIDLAAPVAAMQFDTPPQVIAPVGRFVRQIFHSVLAADAGLADLTDREKHLQRIRRLVVMGGLGTALVAVTITLGSFSCANQGIVERTRSAAINVEQISRDVPLHVTLGALDTLRTQLVTLDSISNRLPAWRALGAYEANRVFEHPASTQRRR
jgi:type VI secretion system protein ImpL